MKVLFLAYIFIFSFSSYANSDSFGFLLANFGIEKTPRVKTCTEQHFEKSANTVNRFDDIITGAFKQCSFTSFMKESVNGDSEPVKPVDYGVAPRPDMNPDLFVPSETTDDYVPYSCHCLKDDNVLFSDAEKYKLVQDYVEKIEQLKLERMLDHWVGSFFTTYQNAAFLGTNYSEHRDKVLKGMRNCRHDTIFENLKDIPNNYKKDNENENKSCNMDVFNKRLNLAFKRFKKNPDDPNEDAFKAGKDHFYKLVSQMVNNEPVTLEDESDQFSSCMPYSAIMTMKNKALKKSGGQISFFPEHFIGKEMTDKELDKFLYSRAKYRNTSFEQGFMTQEYWATTTYAEDQISQYRLEAIKTGYKEWDDPFINMIINNRELYKKILKDGGIESISKDNEMPTTLAKTQGKQCENMSKGPEISRLLCEQKVPEMPASFFSDEIAPLAFKLAKDEGLDLEVMKIALQSFYKKKKCGKYAQKANKKPKKKGYGRKPEPVAQNNKDDFDCKLDAIKGITNCRMDDFLHTRTRAITQLEKISKGDKNTPYRLLNKFVCKNLPKECQESNPPYKCNSKSLFKEALNKSLEPYKNKILKKLDKKIAELEPRKAKCEQFLDDFNKDEICKKKFREMTAPQRMRCAYSRKQKSDCNNLIKDYNQTIAEKSNIDYSKYFKEKIPSLGIALENIDQILNEESYAPKTQFIIGDDGRREGMELTATTVSGDDMFDFPLIANGQNIPTEESIVPDFLLNSTKEEADQVEAWATGNNVSIDGVVADTSIPYKPKGFPSSTSRRDVTNNGIEQNNLSPQIPSIATPTAIVEDKPERTERAIANTSSNSIVSEPQITPQVQNNVTQTTQKEEKPQNTIDESKTKRMRELDKRLADLNDQINNKKSDSPIDSKLQDMINDLKGERDKIKADTDRIRRDNRRIGSQQLDHIPVDTGRIASNNLSGGRLSGGVRNNVRSAINRLDSNLGGSAVQGSNQSIKDKIKDMQDQVADEIAKTKQARENHKNAAKGGGRSPASKGGSNDSEKGISPSVAMAMGQSFRSPQGIASALGYKEGKNYDFIFEPIIPYYLILEYGLQRVINELGLEGMTFQVLEARVIDGCKSEDKEKCIEYYLRSYDYRISEDPLTEEERMLSMQTIREGERTRPELYWKNWANKTRYLGATPLIKTKDIRDAMNKELKDDMIGLIQEEVKERRLYGKE